jgi:hypothetical protein
MRLVDLWCRLRERGYTRYVKSLYRVLKRTGVKVAPRSCCVYDMRLFQHTFIDEFTRLRYLAPTRSKAPIIRQTF